MAERLKEQSRPDRSASSELAVGRVAYVDIFGFWRADVINGALAGKVPGPGFEINQTLLVIFTSTAPPRHC